MFVKPFFPRHERLSYEFSIISPAVRITVSIYSINFILKVADSMKLFHKKVKMAPADSETETAIVVTYYVEY